MGNSPKFERAKPKKTRTLPFFHSSFSLSFEDQDQTQGDTLFESWIRQERCEFTSLFNFSWFPGWISVPKRKRSEKSTWKISDSQRTSEFIKLFHKWVTAFHKVVVAAKWTGNNCNAMAMMIWDDPDDRFQNWCHSEFMDHLFEFKFYFIWFSHTFWTPQIIYCRHSQWSDLWLNSSSQILISLVANSQSALVTFCHFYFEFKMQNHFGHPKDVWIY